MHEDLAEEVNQLSQKYELAGKAIAQREYVLGLERQVQQIQREANEPGEDVETYDKKIIEGLQQKVEELSKFKNQASDIATVAVYSLLCIIALGIYTCEYIFLN